MSVSVTDQAPVPVATKQRGRPKAPTVESEMDRLAKKFEEYDQKLKELTLDQMNKAPKLETEPQTQLSQNQIAKAKDIYLKPVKSIGSVENFNERFREKWEHSKEYVQFIAENKEMIGEAIEVWTKPYPGLPAEFWQVPTNKPIWGPRHLAEQISRCNYHRLISQESTIVSADGFGTYHGSIVVDNTVSRLEVNPVSQKKTVFLGSKTF